MKFRAYITGDFEIPDKYMWEAYGTTDPYECAEIDEEESNKDPQPLLDDLTNVQVRISPFLERDNS